MLPGGFKKDSRVWLHKNAHVYQKKALTSDGYKVQHNDDVYNHVTEDPYLTPSPYITDEFGKVFKKDSRTWLHKVEPSFLYYLTFRSFIIFFLR